MEGKQCEVLLLYTDLPGTVFVTAETEQHEKAITEHADALFKIFNDYARKTIGIKAKGFQIEIRRR